MKVKTADLIGPAFDWAVAKCEWGNKFANSTDLVQVARRQGYSTNWAQGGPIIERENIDLISPTPSDPLWQAMQWRFAHGAKGPTPLVAAMRCYCCAKLGEYVDIPEELCQRANS